MLRRGPGSTFRESLLWAQFVGLALAWGSSFALTKIALGALTSEQLVWFRVVLGAAVLGILVVIRRTELPRTGSTWAHLSVVATTSCLLPFLLFAFAQQYLASSLASVFLAMTPLMSVVGAFVFKVEQPGIGHLLAVVLGLGGVALMLLGGDADSAAPAQWGIVACLAAALSYGFNYGYVRRFLSHSGHDQVGLAFITIAISAVIMLLSTPIVFRNELQFDGAVLLSLLVLGPVGTGIAYVWSFTLIRDWGSVRTSFVSYVIPVIGILIGTSFMSETLETHEIAGMVLVMLGLLIMGVGRRHSTRRRRTLPDQK